MPVSIDGLMAKTAEIELKFKDGDTLKMTYRPFFLSQELGALMTEGDTPDAITKQNEALAKAITAWDLTEGKDAKPVAITVKTFERLGTAMSTFIGLALLADASPFQQIERPSGVTS
jgi:hypothetical protein